MESKTKLNGTGLKVFMTVALGAVLAWAGWVSASLVEVQITRFTSRDGTELEERISTRIVERLRRIEDKLDRHLEVSH